MDVLDLKTPEELLDYMSDFEYQEFETLQNPLWTDVAKEGSCHDQAYFELDILHCMHVHANAAFLMAVDDAGHGGETHTFVYYNDDSLFFWFENSWDDYKGIHPYISEQDLFKDVIWKFKDRNPDMTVYLGEFIPGNHAIGEDLSTFVDICMENAVQV